MKKVLATVAALGLVLGVAASALALDKPGEGAEVESDTIPRVAAPTAPGVALWSVAGQWSLAGAYLSNGLGAPGQMAVKDNSDSNDTFYIYSFKLLPVLQVNDKISMKGELRFADRDVFGDSDTQVEGGRQIDTYTLWMEWMSPIGKTQFGRMPAGAWGTKFKNSSRQGNRLRLYPNMLPENWGMLIFTEKSKEQDVANGPNISDQDSDHYYIDLSYKAGFGKTVGALFFVRNATGGIEPYVDSRFWLSGNYSFDNIGFEYEFIYEFGDASSTMDRDAMGFYGDLSYKVQDWKLGGLFFWATGDDGTDNDSEALLTSGGTGNDFNPFQILTGDYMGLLNADKGQVHADIVSGGYSAGVWALQGYANYAMSSALSLSGYVGYAAATDEPTGWDDGYGLEAGVGFSYKLMDNLSYGAHFSYLWTGDFFTNGAANHPTQDVYLVANALSMKF